MKVKAKISFGATDRQYADGEEFQLPEGVDWLECGLVELVELEETPKPKKKNAIKKANDSES